MRGVIDRFEGEFAVVEHEDQVMVDIPRGELPENAKVGDVISLIEGKYILDKAETQRRRAEIEELSRNLWE